MKTPYDPVVRIGRREVETIQLALRAEMLKMAALAVEADKLARHIADEYELAARDWSVFTTHDWLRQKKILSATIDLHRVEAEAKVTRLRDLAGQAYGRMRAAESATQTYVERVEAAEARKAQAEADDLVSARRLLAARRRKRRERQDCHVLSS